MNTRFESIKSFLIQAGAAVLASAVTALFNIPEQQLQFNSLALGIISIPIFLALGAAGVFLHGMFLVVVLIERIGVNLGMFDVVDGL